MERYIEPLDKISLYIVCNVCFLLSSIFHILVWYSVNMEGKNSSILFKGSEKNIQFGADADISMTKK